MSSKREPNRIDPKFPKVDPGNDCGGRGIYAPDGRRVGTLYRLFNYKRPSLMSETYVNTVAAYQVEDFDSKPHDFKTLAEATAFARSMPYGPPPPPRDEIVNVALTRADVDALRAILTSHGGAAALLGKLPR